MELTALIDRLEEAINSGTGLPAGRVLMEREKLTELLGQIRAALPTDIQEAQELLQMRENLINQAIMEARRIKNAAEEDARARVGESEITKEARKQSEEFVEEAQRKAQRILDETDAQANTRRASADQYAQAALQKLEEELSQVLDTVRHGIEILDAEKEPSV